MGRLNSCIKLAFCLSELFFLVVSLLCLGFSVLVSTDNVAALSFGMAKETAKLVGVLAGAVFICSCYGCCGALRQTIRKGLCSGRKILCLHQLLLVAVLLFTLSQHEWINKREYSLRLVAEDKQSYNEYDKFEMRSSKLFNNAYFESICSSEDDKSTAWLSDFVDKNCPLDMSQDSCTLSSSNKKKCDTSCSALKGMTDYTTHDIKQCCPSQELCNEGVKAACPYERCRVGIATELVHWAHYTKIATQFVCSLAGFLLILSLLLVCFNPRDEIEQELLKTGVMTEEDVEAIRQLKETHNVKSKRRGSISVQELDTLKGGQNSFFGMSKRNSARVSPVHY